MASRWISIGQSPLHINFSSIPQTLVAPTVPTSCQDGLGKCSSGDQAAPHGHSKWSSGVPHGATLVRTFRQATHLLFHTLHYRTRETRRTPEPSNMERSGNCQLFPKRENKGQLVCIKGNHVISAPCVTFGTAFSDPPPFRNLLVLCATLAPHANLGLNDGDSMKQLVGIIEYRRGGMVLEIVQQMSNHLLVHLCDFVRFP